MFTSFFYYMRQRKLHVSMDEWLALLEGMEKGLHHSTLTGFYNLCRAVLIKSEADFDRFDQAFVEFFKDVPYQGELPKELTDWLNHPSDDLARSIEELKNIGFPDETLAALLKKLEERLKEQNGEHNGGNYWVGTQGRSPFGNSGWHPNGIRIGGESGQRTAMLVAGERNFRDFRNDNTLDTRQFQVAFRRLRQLSYQADTSEKELDVDGTVRDTCDNAGTLKIRYRPPRKNMIKLLLLMDSGGSMNYYANLCSMLFQAVTTSNRFKELHTYYFHNCIYDHLYTVPMLGYRNEIPTDWVLKNYDGEYRVIIVGDAMMNESELWDRRYEWRTQRAGETAGIDWIRQFIQRYPYLIWLNPVPRPTVRNFWSQTYLQLAEMLPMYDLSLDGLDAGMRRLMARSARTPAGR